MRSHIIQLRFLVNDIFYVFRPKLLHKDNFVHDRLSWYKIHTKFGHFKGIRHTKFNLRRKIESKIFVKPLFFNIKNRRAGFNIKNICRREAFLSS